MKFGLITAFLFILALFQAGFSQTRDLDYYINQGLSNSPVLKDIDLQMRSGSVDSMLIRAVRLPQINFNTSLSYAPVINGYGYSDPITNGQNLISTVNLNQSLFNKRTTDARYQKIGIENQTLASNRKITENDLRKSITQQYLTVYSIGSDLAFSQSVVKSLEEENEILKQLTAAGVYSNNDYLNFVVELQGRKLLLSEYQIRYRQELSNLNYLCGITDTTTYQLELPDITVNLPVKPEASVYFLPYRLDSLRILNERTLLDRTYKPVVSWFADAGLANNEPKYIYKNFGASIGISFGLPIYDGNQRRLNYEKLKYSEESRRNYQQFFHSQYDEQLRRLMDELEMTQKMLPQIDEELELAKAVIRQDRELLNNGTIIGITDFLLALRNLISIQQYRNQYEIKSLEIINEINYWRQ
jgi:outer membrane protein TolC